MTMYINSVLLHHPYHGTNKTPRPRFQIFCNDLLKSYGKKLNPSSLYQGGQYRFAELGETLFEKCQLLGYLNGLDLLICSNWAHEFDPNVAHWGPYLAHRFKLTCDMFDITEQGTMSSYSALHWIQQLALCSHVNKAMLLGLEQTTIAQALSDTTIVPKTNGAGVLVLERMQPAHHCLRIITTSILTLSNPVMPLPQLIADWLAAQGATAQVHWHRSTSLLTIFKALAALMHGLPARSNKVLLVEPDVFSQQVGLLLLEPSQCRL